eukprot:gnl/MRDRNA2_/MRDRNA2_112566_c0_seq1.p1 gnl/MRDRNA2_/MRDRNA2_112566_c0~~gnl/MRDRNA2_/MRDRNA2_112566_c0_seq1.p1  ORF type:complete len:134 (+),score=15.64 gnl/MRDRNA2_/MRDRNA2_112566_c0_seq1:60-404(+)
MAPSAVRYSWQRGMAAAFAGHRGPMSLRSFGGTKLWKIQSAKWSSSSWSSYPAKKALPVDKSICCSDAHSSPPLVIAEANAKYVLAVAVITCVGFVLRDLMAAYDRLEDMPRKE